MNVANFSNSLEQRKDNKKSFTYFGISYSTSFPGSKRDSWNEVVSYFGRHVCYECYPNLDNKHGSKLSKFGYQATYCSPLITNQLWFACEAVRVLPTSRMKYITSLLLSLGRF